MNRNIRPTFEVDYRSCCHLAMDPFSFLALPLDIVYVAGPICAVMLFHVRVLDLAEDNSLGRDY